MGEDILSIYATPLYIDFSVECLPNNSLENPSAEGDKWCAKGKKCIMIACKMLSDTGALFRHCLMKPFD